MARKVEVGERLVLKQFSCSKFWSEKRFISISDPDQKIKIEYGSVLLVRGLSSDIQKWMGANGPDFEVIYTWIDAGGPAGGTIDAIEAATSKAIEARSKNPFGFSGRSIAIDRLEKDLEVEVLFVPERPIP